MAVLARIAADVADLRRSGLAGHLHAGQRQPGLRRGAVRLVHHREHAGPQRRQMVLRQAERRPVSRLHRRLQHLVEAARQMRLHRAAGGDPGGVGGELQRRHRDEALADAGIDGVAAVPVMSLGAAQRRGRDLPGALVRQLDVERGAEAERVRGGGDRLHAGATRHLVEEHVAGELDAAMQVERAMAVLGPAMEARAADIDIAAAVDPVAGRERAGLQRRHRHRRLEGGAGRIDAGDGLVDQRGALVGGPFRPLRLADAGIEQARIEGRRADHRQHLAVARIHHHRAGGLVADPGQHRLLQAEIDGQPDGGALLPLAAVELAHHPADGIDFHLHRARRAAQHGVMELLDAGAADTHAGQRQIRIGGDVALVGRRHVADHVRHRRALRVEPGGADIDQDAGQVGRVDLDPGHVVPGQEVVHHHGDEFAAVLEFAVDPGALALVERQDGGEAVQGGADVGGLFRQQQRAPVHLVAAEAGAEPVDDAAARRRQQAVADAVVLGERRVFAAVGDLQTIQALAQRAEGGDLDAHQQQRPPGEDAARRDLVRGASRRSLHRHERATPWMDRRRRDAPR